MALTDIIARLKLNAEGFTNELNSKLGGVEKRFSTTGSVIGRNISTGVGGGLQDAAARVPVLGNALAGLSGPALVAAGGIGAVTAALAFGLAQAEEYQRAVRGLGAVLDATGNKTGLAKAELLGFAEDLEGKFAVPAEEIIKAEEALSSFDGVAGSTFKRAITLAGDMSQVFGGDLASNSEKLGTVLQNLAAGDVEGLGRGFKFLGIQTLDTISQLAKTGDTAAAQEALLKALEDRVGGAGEAGGKGVSGAFFRMADAIGDASREFVVQTGIYGGVESGLNRVANSADGVGASMADAAKHVATFAANLLLGNTEGAVKSLFANAPAAGKQDPLDGNLGFGNVDTIVARRAAAAAKVEGDARREREKKEETDAKGARDAKTAAKRAAEKATAEAVAADKRLDASLADLTRKYEPARQAALDYAAALDVVARGEANHKITNDQAAVRLAGIRKDYFEAEQRLDRQTRDATLKDTGLDEAVRTPLVDLGTSNLKSEMVEAGKAGGTALRDSGLEAVQAITQVLGVKSSSVLGKVLGGVTGAATGNFAGLNSPVGGVLSLLSGKSGTGKGSPFQAGLAEVFDPLKGSFDKLGQKLGLTGPGGIGQTLGKAAGGAAIGSATGQLVGLLGLKGSSTGGALGGAAGSLIGGPLGAAIGGAVGSAVLGAFKTVKKGSATIGFAGGELGVTSTTGNSAKFKAAANDAAGSVIDSLKNIASQLGGDLSGSISTSIGVRHGDYRVDTTGQGITKLKKGAIEFDSDSEAAIRYAISDALQDGVIAGISDAAKRILASGQDLEAAITKASFIESIPKELKKLTDPLGAALDEFEAGWRKNIAILTEAGATAEQVADAHKLYDLQLEQVKASVGGAAATLRDFKASLESGSASPLSLRDQEIAAKAALQPFLDKIDTGGTIDQAKYAAAAQSFLDIERELKGSTAEYFAEFDRIQAATAKGISAIDNAQPIRTASDPFAEATARATQATAEMTGDTNDILAQIAQLMQEVANNTGGGSTADTFIGSVRNYV